MRFMPSLAVAASCMLASTSAMPFSSLFSRKAKAPEGYLVSFGDSLSDTGNVFAWSSGTYPPNPPYYDGRFSNGPVWVESLAEQLNLTLVDLAWGGATTNSSAISEQIKGFTIPGLVQQTQAFLKDQPWSVVDGIRSNASVVLKSDLSTSLFAIWAGGNDYIRGAELNVTVSPTVVAAAIGSSLALLAKAGATKFVVLNLPPGTNIPVAAHATALAAEVKAFKKAYKKVTVTAYNVRPIYQRIKVSPSKYGLVNVTAPCVTQFKNGSYSECSDPDNYLRFDKVHPTSQVHKILADAVYNDLK
ncbi:hypothetical protein HKX48_009340 [Thoreauomyces humboldtii]|nr:hypothetical protein HKX48_009340 [Thoreauomyces humboldtii]